MEKYIDKGLQQITSELELYNDYINFCSRFYNLDWMNQILVFMQNKDGRLVASKVAWSNLNRNIIDSNKRIYGCRPVIGAIDKETCDIKLEPILIYDYDNTEGDEIKDDEDINIDILEKLLEIREITVRHTKDEDVLKLPIVIEENEENRELILYINQQTTKKEQNEFVLKAFIETLYHTLFQTNGAQFFEETVISHSILVLKEFFGLRNYISEVEVVLSEINNFEEKYKKNILAFSQLLIHTVISIFYQESMNFTQTSLFKQIISIDVENNIEFLLQALNAVDAENEYYYHSIMSIIHLLMRLDDEDKEMIISKYKDDEVFTYPPLKINAQYNPCMLVNFLNSP